VELQLALDACDPGLPLDEFKRWLESHDIKECVCIRQEVVVTPKRTEIIIELPGDNSFEVNEI